jgi:hypothetical protein
LSNLLNGAFCSCLFTFLGISSTLGAELQRKNN